MKRLPLYLGLLVLFTLTIGLLGAMGANSNPRALYLIALFAICSSPLLYVHRLNGRYSILCAFMAFYFMFYGAGDVLALLSPSRTTVSGSVVATEVAALLGVAMAALGYRLAAGSDVTRDLPPGSDWPLTWVLVLGFLIWATGAFATGYWQIFVLKQAWAKVSLGQLEGLIVTAARYLHPVGLALLAYATVVSRNRSLMIAVLGVLSIEFMVGFVSDTKEAAFRGAAILLVAKFLLEGKVPKTWIAIAAAVVIVSTPIFQAYRTVISTRHLDRGAAAQDLGTNLERAFDLRDFKRGKSVYGSMSFLERSSLKGTLQMTIERVGTEAQYQRGKTILLYFTGFVPRFFWPDKPNASTGQLFNKELDVTVRGVYISPTVLGELYWNFGWPGIIVGMLVFGYVLGTVNTRCNLVERRSVTRFLLITTTVYLLCVRFEDNIAMTFIVWTRSILAIGILHLMFAQRQFRGGGVQSEPHLLLSTGRSS